MTKFEYMYGIAPLNVDILNEKGRDGWEYIDHVDNPQGGPPVLFFKRQIVENVVPTTGANPEVKRKASKKEVEEIVVE